MIRPKVKLGAHDLRSTPKQLFRLNRYFFVAKSLEMLESHPSWFDGGHKEKRRTERARLVLKLQVIHTFATRGLY